MESKEDKKDPAEGMSADEIREKLMEYEMKRWQEDRGKYVEFDIKTMNKYQKYYEEMTTINPDGEETVDSNVAVEFTLKNCYIETFGVSL